MSRYLEYCSTKLALRPHTHSLNEPEAWGHMPIMGPQPEFRWYLSQQYKGKSGVFGGGRFVLGQMGYRALVVVFVFGPCWFYIARVLAGKASDMMASVQTALAAVMTISYCIAAFTNPGILPRQPAPPERSDVVQYIPRGTRPEDRFLRIKDVTVKQKYCWTCKIYRPPRSKHCGICDNCVLRFDHHCPFLGNCVGLHNYRYFCTLLYSSLLFLSLAIYTIGAWFAETVESVIIDEPLTLFLMLYMFVFFLGVAVLSAYHTFITTKNLTTNEHVVDYYSGNNPFDLGLLSNMRHTWCFPERVVLDGHDVVEIDYRKFNNDYDSPLSAADGHIAETTGY